jgi:predicted O-methyltransferase YrrM
MRKEMISLSIIGGGMQISRLRYPVLRRSTWKSLLRLYREYPDCWPWMYLSKQIDGWLTPDEAASLFQLAKNETPQRNPIVIELGSFKGKSSVMLAAGLMGKEFPSLYCVDVFGPTDDPSYETWLKPAIETEQIAVETQFRRNIAVANLDRIITPVRGFSYEIAKTWNMPIHMLFIDANHEYDAVVRDIECWTQFLVPGGIIAFHDVNDNWPGTKRAFSEKITAPMYGPAKRVDSLAWTVKAYGGSQSLGAASSNCALI